MASLQIHIIDNLPDHLLSAGSSTLRVCHNLDVIWSHLKVCNRDKSAGDGEWAGHQTKSIMGGAGYNFRINSYIIFLTFPTLFQNILDNMNFNIIKNKIIYDVAYQRSNLTDLIWPGFSTLPTFNNHQPVNTSLCLIFWII